jgi:hypothetical protein
MEDNNGDEVRARMMQRQLDEAERRREHQEHSDHTAGMVFIALFVCFMLYCAYSSMHHHTSKDPDCHQDYNGCVR